MAGNGAVAGCRTFAAEIATKSLVSGFSDLKVQSDPRVDDKVL